MEQGLQTELHAGAARSDDDADVTGNAGGDHAAAGMRGRAPAEQPVDAVSNERQHERHVEAIGANGGDAAVSEQQRLDYQRHGDGDHRGPRSEQDCHQRAATRGGWNRRESAR